MFIPVLSATVAADLGPELELEVKGGIGIKVVIRNSGDTGAYDVEWCISMHGVKILFPRDAFFGVIEGKISCLAPDGEKIVRVIPFGFGIARILVKVSGSNHPGGFSTLNARVMGPFVLGL
jgi:hypothetical protein